MKTNVMLEIDARLEHLDSAIERGLTDADSGKLKDADEVFDRLEAKYCQLSARAK